MKVLLFSIVLFSLSNAKQLSAQEVVRCGTWQYMQLQQQKNPGYMQRWKNAVDAARKWSEANTGETRLTYTIPVVVHVVYNTTAQNISDQLIYSQIDVLNEDFNRQNADTFETPSVWKAIGGNIPVKFCLAAYDPGGIQTTGITRDSTSVDTFDAGTVKHNSSGGVNGWPSQYYLNIWVCNLERNTLGVASFDPGGADDGVVITTKAFGRISSDSKYNLGRTSSHEVGHWLSLSHIWGDDDGTCSGSDEIDDTPNQADSVMGCPDFPHFDKCGEPDGVMFMNYMDYTDDACMNMFTIDQCSLMKGILNTSRSNLENSPAECQEIQHHLDASLSTVIFPGKMLPLQGFIPRVQLTNHGSDDLTFVKINYRVDGQPVTTFNYTTSLLTGTSEVASLPEYFTGEHGHIFYAWTSEPNYGIDEFIFNDSSYKNFSVESSVPVNTVKVFPNPSPDQVSVEVQNPTDDIMHLQMVNLLGQIVKQGNWNVFENTPFIVDLSDLSNGLYFLYGKIGYNYVKEKIIVERK